ncbi:threonine synthase [Mogibacterium sp. NSJ-24]|jgi:threonine synthase|uniref:Threonine synthase n=1 Tax=Lentihominibacter hominis TaxID=2763645 RepID=A0A926I7X6_9FIRM|nr:threonine synthase [Lentihominibacter hominis]MBC8567556.1 threonine synthase [Lentihominibacter hominis]
MISYKSTRGSKNIKTAAQAVIQGIAEDKGLYVPDSIPALPKKISEFAGKPYKDVAREIIKAFFTDYTDDEMQLCVDGAYDEKFEEKEIVPVRKAGGAYFLELYHGKTAAFKDMALSILPYLLTTAMKKEKEKKKICILTATSGDTGKAALEGFADVPGTEIIVFFPNQGVSEVQERQMVTQEGNNTHVFAIEGNFDDAQTGVKKIFNDTDFAEKLAESGCRLSSANSINIGRLIPQVAYYVYGYVKLVERGVINDGDKVNIVVPTGNFGNILAAYYAGSMGIPVNKFICASNENKVLTDFFETGVYDINREFYLTNSPSMDILISSNLERLLYHLAGNDGEEIQSLMTALDTKKRYEVSEKFKEGMKDFYGGFATVKETNEAIGEMYSESGYLMDTHTAVAYKVYEDYVKETGDETPALIASTASAYKFADSVAHSIGLGDEENGFAYVKALEEKTGVRVPAGLKDLDKKPVRHRGVIEIGQMAEAVEDSVK